jgi:Fe-S-cluster-containing hydrogenase component 2
MPWVDTEECMGCGICVSACPVGAISMEQGKAAINMEKCIRCGKCHDACPTGAIRLGRDIPDSTTDPSSLIKKPAI